MHIAFVDATPGTLDAIAHAKDAGHVVSFLESPEPYYPATAENASLIGRADRIMRGVPTTDAPALTAALARCHAWKPVDFAVSQHEMAVEAVALSCKALGLPGTSPDAVLTARRKDLLRTALREAGIAGPPFAVARDPDEALRAADSIGYPVVVKPPSGADSRLASVARDRAHVRAACDRILAGGVDALPPGWRPQFTRGLLVEGYLAGPLISVEIGMRDERGYVFCISGRTRARDDEVIEIGPHIPAELPGGQERDCAAYAESVCRAIGLDRGVFHLEMIVTARGPVLVEANPRIMGGIMPTVYQHATGRSIYNGFLQVISGAAVDCAPPAFGGCVTGRRFFARADTAMPASWETGWLDSNAGQLIRFDPPDSLGLRPLQAVRRGQVIARMISRGPDYAATAKAGTRISDLIQDSWKIPLLYGEYDICNN